MIQLVITIAAVIAVTVTVTIRVAEVTQSTGAGETGPCSSMPAP